MDYVFTKLSSENNTKFTIHAKFITTGLELIFLQKGQAWKSTVSEEELIVFSKSQNIIYSEYRTRLVNYLNSSDTSEAIFIINNEEFIINRILDSCLKLVFFRCKIKEDNYNDLVETLLSDFHHENATLTNKLDAVTSDKNQFDAYKTKCELKLKELVEAKKTEQEELYGRFILILNEKKKRIQHLCELLAAFEGGRPTENPPVKNKGKKKKAQKDEFGPKKLQMVSESSSSDNESSASFNTDEELAPVVINDEPSTSKQSYNFLKDDLDEDEPSKSSKLPKRHKSNNLVNDIILKPTNESELEEQKPVENKTKKRSDSPTVDFDTQQLLDLL